MKFSGKKNIVIATLLASNTAFALAEEPTEPSVQATQIQLQTCLRERNNLDDCLKAFLKLQQHQKQSSTLNKQSSLNKTTHNTIIDNHSPKTQNEKDKSQRKTDLKTKKQNQHTDKIKAQNHPGSKEKTTLKNKSKTNHKNASDGENPKNAFTERRKDKEELKIKHQVGRDNLKRDNIEVNIDLRWIIHIYLTRNFCPRRILVLRFMRLSF